MTPMLALRLPPEFERRLDALARETGRTKSFYARAAIVRYLEELEDEQLAAGRLDAATPGFDLGELERELPEVKPNLPCQSGREAPMVTASSSSADRGFAEGAADWVVEAARGNLDIGPDGSLSVPKSLLGAAGIEASDVVLARVVNGEVRLSGYAASLNRAQWIAKHFHRPGASEVDDFIAERRAAGARGE